MIFDEDKKIEMLNVVGMSITEAGNVLSDKGFTNIVSNIDSSASEDKWIVMSQNINSGARVLPDTEIKLFCNKKCQLYIDVKSEGNLLFNKYDMTISLDGQEIGTVANGAVFSQLIEVLDGEHEIVFCKAGSSSPISTKAISVTNDMTFGCDIAHGSDTIELKNIHQEQNADGGALEVIDVTGMVLAEAIDALKEKGFVNVREEPSGEIWDKNGWIVTGQDTEAGTTADKNIQIKLWIFKIKFILVMQEIIFFIFYYM